MDPGEECDDANTRDFDGCSSTCFLENGYCGDGIVQHAIGEQCEVSSHPESSQYGCSPDCRYLLRYCGNDRLDPGEECDDGVRNSNMSNALCRKDCSRQSCGDEILDRGEQCDDGNLLSGDGCDKLCQAEFGAPGSLWAGGPYPGYGQVGQYGQLGQYPGFGQGTLPTYPTTQSVPYSLPFASISQQATSHAPVGDTGPIAAGAMAAGAAAGFAWMRRRIRR